MKPAEHASHAASSLEEELLRMLARQARRIPFYVLLAALMIAALASERVPAWLVGGSSSSPMTREARACATRRDLGVSLPYECRPAGL